MAYGQYTEYQRQNLSEEEKMNQTNVSEAMKKMKKGERNMNSQGHADAARAKEKEERRA